MAQLAAIVEDSEDIILSTTLDGIILNWNKSAWLTYGYTESEMVGKSISILVPPELKDEVFQIFEKIKNGIPISVLRQSALER
ncbi:MAG: PAS domain S-box protein [Anaerolineales bacterium]|nr:PAS domain S-box protein [Anaerolineales bacterium]